VPSCPPFPQHRVCGTSEFPNQSSSTLSQTCWQHGDSGHVSWVMTFASVATKGFNSPSLTCFWSCRLRNRSIFSKTYFDEISNVVNLCVLCFSSFLTSKEHMVGVTSRCCTTRSVYTSIDSLYQLDRNTSEILSKLSLHRHGYTWCFGMCSCTQGMEPLQPSVQLWVAWAFMLWSACHPTLRFLVRAPT
jgi:hypothetical protein